MEVAAGFIFALLIGLSLGIIGGGGSILTVPVLVYIMGINPVNSTAYSLFIVGITALAGAYSYFKKNLLCYRAAIVFSIPSFTAVFYTRQYLVPLIPAHIADFSGFIITKEGLIMLLFAFMMIVSAYSMIRQRRIESPQGEVFRPDQIRFNYPLIAVEGIVVGILTGLVGAGGGFLIIPALVLLVRLPMKVAIGTSLLIIAAKSLIGFAGDLQTGMVIEWVFLLSFSSFALLGIAIGIYYAKNINGEKLKPVFGWFTLVLGFSILIKELFFR